MRVAALVIFLILIGVAFIPRAGDDGQPVAPSSTTDAEAIIPDAVVGPTGEEKPDAEPEAPPTGILRYRIVASNEEDAPPVPGAVVTIYRQTHEDWVEVGRAVADADGRAEVDGLIVDPQPFWQDYDGEVRAEGRGRVHLPFVRPEEDPKTRTVA